MDVQIFDNAQFGNIRAINMDGEPWFVGKDVATALGYSKSRNAISTHVDEDDKTTALILGPGSNYKTQAIIINNKISLTIFHEIIPIYKYIELKP